MPSPTSRACALLLACAPLSLAACSADIAQEVAATSDPPHAALVWSRTYGGPFDDSARSLTLTADDHARFAGHGPLDGSTDPAEARGLLMGVDEAGSLAAHQRIGASSVYLVGIERTAVGLNGELVVAGRFEHESSIAGCALVSPLGFGGEYLAALDDQGACLWATTFAAEADFTSLDVSAAGDIVLAGEGKPGASLGAGVTLPAPPYGGATFYALFSPTGAPLSAHATDGYFEPIVRFDPGGGLLVATGPTLLRRDAQGATTWSHELPEETSITELVVVGSSVVLASSSAGSVALSSLQVSDGAPVWTLDLSGGAPGDLAGLVLGAGPDGALSIAAHVAGSEGVSLGETTLASHGNDNLLWALLDGSGGVIRSKVVPFEATVFPSAVATNASGDVWVLGTFTGSADFGDGLHAGHPQPPPKSWMDPTGYDVFLARYH